MQPGLFQTTTLLFEINPMGIVRLLWVQCLCLFHCCFSVVQSVLYETTIWSHLMMHLDKVPSLRQFKAVIHFSPQWGDGALCYHPQHIKWAVLPAQRADREHGTAGPIHHQCFERFCTGPNLLLILPSAPDLLFICLCIQLTVALSPLLPLLLYHPNHTSGLY